MRDNEKTLVDAKRRAIIAKRFHRCVNKDARREQIERDIREAHIYRCFDAVKLPDNKYVMLFCVLKNEASKIGIFLDYYRKIGVNKFVILDNGSTDGTFQYLRGQKDVNLYYTDAEYTSERRVAWLNILLEENGKNAWCIVVDSDEFISYIDMEYYKIDAVIARAIERKLDRVEGFLLDMYSKEKIFQCEGENCFEQMTFFDSCGYEVSNWRHGIAVKGGPRKRIFDTLPYLSKFPLFYYNENIIYSNSHYLFPDCKVDNCHMWFAIRHYKFVGPDDYQKMRIATEKENYYNCSEEYKCYLRTIEREKELRFYDDSYSANYINSHSLKMINFLFEIGG